MFTDADSQHKTAERMFYAGAGNRSGIFVNRLTEGFKVTKYDLVQKIIQAAQAYQNGLVGKTFMYVFNKQQIEVTYKTSNFCHLTGVGTNLSAKDFFDKSRKGVLSETEIDFSKHYIRDIKRKVNHLIDMANMVTSECLMLKDINTKSILLKYGVTDMVFSVCFDINVNASGQKTDFFFPRTLRHGDSFNKSQTAYTVTHIFCKRSDKKRYDTVLYVEKGETLCGLPREIKEKLGSHLAKGEKFIESCQYLFKESKKILCENPELNAEFQKLKQLYLSKKGLSPAPDVTDNMSLVEKFNATEKYYDELCSVITLDENFKNRYKIARDNYRENKTKALSSPSKSKPLVEYKKHKR